MISCVYLKTIILFTIAIYSFVSADDDNWEGQWFPHSPGVEDNNKIFELRKDLYNPEHEIVMGVKNPHCDDAKTNLEVDWDFNPLNYTCFVFNRRIVYKPRSDLHPIHSKDYIPKGYNAPHKCMDEAINYEIIVPTYGTHRPLWAKYGEYTFLPRQRWVHNLEHGAVVMLYHPCADQNQVNILKTLVKKCLYRHIITPFNLLPPERPLALVTWGHKLQISKVDPDIVIDFIRKHALRGPEQTARDGQYNLMLKNHAEIVSDLEDHDLCQFHNYIE